MRLKRIYEYLGDGDFDLNTRATARCPSCCPPDLPTPLHQLLVGEDRVSSIAADSCRVVGVTDNTYVIVYKDKSTRNLKAVGYSINSDLTVIEGLPVTIRATDCGASTGSSSFNFAATKHDENKILVVFGENTQVNAYAVVLTVSGNSITNVGALNTLFATASFAGIEAEEITTNTVVLTYNNVSETKARSLVLTISSDVVTAFFSTAKVIAAVSVSYRLTKIDSTRLAVLVANPNNSVLIISVVGTETFINTAINLTSSGWSVGNLNQSDIAVNSTLTKIAISGLKTGGVASYVALSISGVSLTFLIASVRDATPTPAVLGIIQHTIPNNDLIVSMYHNTSAFHSRIEVNKGDTLPISLFHDPLQITSELLAVGITNARVSSELVAWAGVQQSLPNSIVTGVVLAT